MTFLFTDVEGSTLLWERDAEAMRAALESHDLAMRAAVAAHAGVVFATSGDGFAVAFARAGDAVAAAVDAQASLVKSDWPAPFHVRMGIHTGEAVERNGDYFGPTANRAARIMAAAHGGQVLLSSVTASLAAGQLPGGSGLRDLGEHRLRDLPEPEHIFQLVHPGLQSDFGPLRSLDSFPGNLPVQPTGFVGREAELAEIAKALELSRVVTLCGVGGVGKTRLALEVATDLLPRFKDGAWLLDLASVDQADALDEAVAAGLGVHQRPGAAIAQSVIDFLREKSLLLILDNCEHVLVDAARFVERAVGAAPGLRIVATSREGLAVSGEKVITVPSLELPGPGITAMAALDTEAVRLFAERARESNSTFVAGVQDAAPMAELCRRLDGIPLAIELAAARIRGMTPGEITDHLDRRFNLLTRGRRTATTRHQTLRNTIDWSYDLLEEPERRLFRRLAIFAGDFGLEAAESVVAGDGLDSFDVLDLLLRLVEKSLVVAEGRGATTRYHLLETIRDYAWERLEVSRELDAVGAKHARHFVDLAVEASAGLESPDELLYRARVEENLEDLRAALRWSISMGDTDGALTEVYALTTAGSLRSPPFGMMALQAAQMPGASDHRLQATALGSVCMTLTQQGVVEEALAMAEAAERAASRFEDSAEAGKLRCRLRGCLTTAIAYSGNFERVLQLAQEELADARAIGDHFETARALILLAGTLGVDEVDDAIQAGEEGLQVAREIGVPSYLAWAPMILAGRLATTDPARAEQLLEEAVRAATLADNDFAKTMAVQQLATAQAAQGDYYAAARSLLEMAAGARARGDLGSAQGAVLFLACMLAQFGDDEAALLTGIWAEQHGVAFNRMSPRDYTFVALDAPTYIALRDGLAHDVVSSYIDRARVLDQAAVLEFARTHVERFTGQVVGDPEPGVAEVEVTERRGTQLATTSMDEFRREGDVWLLTYDGRTCRLKDAKGLQYLAALLDHPGGDVHVFDLVGGGVNGVRSAEVLDAAAKASYRRRLGELEAEGAEATEWGDAERADRARLEAEAIAAELTAAYGLGGRPRSAADPTERARKAVANRIRDALSRIDEAHPALGRHLRNSVRTGTFCSYRPERPTSWNGSEGTS